MATSNITNTIKDASGTPLSGVTVRVRLRPNGGFRISDNSEITKELTTTTNGSGVWTLPLEQQANITPSGSWYEVIEEIPPASGFPSSWAISVGNANATLQASLVTPVPPTGLSAFLSQATGDARYTLAANSLVFNIKDHGATGDGVTDDLAAIQATINLCIAAGGGTVFFPLTAAHYLVSGTILVTSDRVTLLGAGYATRELTTGIRSTSTTLPVLKVLGSSAGGNFDGTLEDFNCWDLNFGRTAMGAVGSKTVVVQNTILSEFNHCSYSKSQQGLYAKNVNGLRLTRTHGTIGGDLTAADHLYGIYVDGSSQGSTGIVIDDYLFYGYASPTSVTHAYYDTATGTAGTGDRRIKNFEVDGNVNYGIELYDAGGFSSDVQIEMVTMDSIQTAGIIVTSDAPHVWQQLAITDAWINLTNSSSVARCISINHRKNASVKGVTFSNSGTGTSANVGLEYNNCGAGAVTGNVWTGSTFTKVADINSTADLAFTGNAADIGANIYATDVTGSVFANNPLPHTAIVWGGTNTGSVAANNPGYNPVGVLVVAVPASGNSVAAAPYARTFYITSAGVSSTHTIQNGPAVVVPANTCVAVRVPAGKTLAVLYGGAAPTWVVEGE